MRDESRPLNFPVLLAVSGSPSRLSSSLKSREFHGFDTPKVKGAASHEPFGLREREEILHIVAALCDESELKVPEEAKHMLAPFLKKNVDLRRHKKRTLDLRTGFTRFDLVILQVHLPLTMCSPVTHYVLTCHSLCTQKRHCL